MPSPNDKKPGWSQLSDYASIGVMLPACTVVGYYLGVLLDHLLHTDYLYIVFLLVGIAAGFVELIRIVSKRAG